jgi:predicted kinase
VSIVLLSGLPGSGKSTEARRWVGEAPLRRMRINYDELRERMFGPAWKFNRDDEMHMKAMALKQARNWLTHSNGDSVIIDNLNLTTNAKKPWIELAKELGQEVRLMEMDTPIEECIRRDKKREGKARVGEAVITRWALTTGMIDWKSWVGQFIIVDMDGTLADCTARRHHLVPVIRHHAGCTLATAQIVDGKCLTCGAKEKADWLSFFKDCDQDPPVGPIKDLVWELASTYHVLIVSGRPHDLCGIKTEDWLLRHKIPYELLFMRPAGDHRSDVLVKEEILSYMPKDRIAYVIDDRNAVVAMWRKHGLTCLQVADGDF